MSLLDTASLIVTPNAYKEGKLYSVIPSDGSGDLSVTRATTATRVNSAGLVELVPYNLLTWSEDLSTSDWTKLNVSITANSTTAPNGTLTADTLTNSSTGYGLWQTISVAPSTQYTFSFYVKKGTNTSYILSVIDASTFSGIASLDYSSQVGTEWVRVSATFTTLSGTTSIRVYPMRDGSSTGTAFLWGAQLVEGSTAKDYQKTETRLNIPRLDYSNGTCPSLLVEPQRTNFLTYSNDYSDSSWTKAGVTPTLGTQINPQGIASTYSIANTTLGDSYLQQQGLPTTAGTYTMSVFLKNIDNVSTTQLMAVHLFEAGNTSQLTYTWSTNTFAISGANAISGNVTPYENGWIRISFTYSIGALTTLHFSRLYANYNLSVTKSALVYGFQTEAGSYPTSYIPTTSASVTRNADVISKTGISSLIGQTEGTLFWEGQINGLSISMESLPISIFASGGNTSGIQAYVSFLPTGAIRFIYFDGAIQCNISTSTSFYTFGTTYKIAVIYKQNDFALYINGVQIGTDNSGNVTAMADLYLDYQGGLNVGAYTTKAVALWKTRLTNTQLAQLTTI